MNSLHRVVLPSAMLWFAGPMVATLAAADISDAAAILQAAQIDGGLVVHIGCSDGKLTAALRSDDRFLVHGLDRDPVNVQRARKHVRRLERYGPVSIDQLTGSSLPYVDNLVRLIVVEDAVDIEREEIIRVLAPQGVALIKGASAQQVTSDDAKSIRVAGLTWTKIVKPQPADIDDWTHYLHDSSGNAVAADHQVSPPKYLRWAAAPMWSRSHEFNPSINAMVSAGGRIFYILDEGIAGLPDLRFPSRWSLVARDAFSGVTLWKRPIPNWGYREWNTVGMWSAPLTLNRRMVTDGQRVFVTLGYMAKVTILDAASGETIGEIPESSGTDELVLCDNTLIMLVREKLSVAAPPKEDSTQKKKRRNPHEWTIGAPGPGTLTAVDVTTNRVLWKTDPQPITVLTPAALGDRVCYHGDNRLRCLDLKSGKPLWDIPCRAGPGSRHSGGTLVMHDDAVLFTSADGVMAFAAEDGLTRWTSTKVSGPGISHPPDLFVAGGLVWGGDYPKQHTKDRTKVVREGRNVTTGEVKRTVVVDKLISPLHHFRCYRSKATEDYLLLTKRGVEFVDLTGDDHMRHDWLRAMCHYGFMPGNGLLYFPPHHCFCYPGVKMNGFLALAGDRGISPTASGPDDGERLVRGPAYESPTDTVAAADWSTYRGDNRRSGHSPDSVSPALHQVWQAKLGGKISQPIVVGDRLYVARSDAHEVCCLSADNGRFKWAFTAGSRIDSPPTYHQGRLLFGCRDGWVYCLNAVSGELAWRFRAAPQDRRIVAFDQLESPWPVPGNVLVLDDVAYVCAGRSTFLDGGLRLYGLDPISGKKLYETCVRGPVPDVQSEEGRPFDMEGAKSDILVTDGTNLYLYQKTFDKQLNEVETPRASNLGDRVSGRRLIATGGFLEDVWFDRTFWMYGDRWPGFYYANDAPKSGQILVFDDETTYGLHVFRDRARLSPSFKPGSGYELFADDNDNEPVLAEKSINREKGPGFSRAQPPLWSMQIPLRAQAMVLAGKRLFMAGPPDVMPEEDPYASFEGRLSAQLWVVSAEDGERLAEYPLDALPVFDGLVAAKGRLFLSSQDGNLTCFGAVQ